MSDKTPEQIAAEAADKKAKAAADAKAAKAEAKAAKDAAKVDAKAKADADKAAAAAKKEADKAATLAAREATKMPEQNGIRRPKADGLCGKAWAIFDSISSANGAAASISEAMEVARSQSLNEANVRAEYARWRKFYGIVGRVDDPRKIAEREAAAKAKADAKAAKEAEKASKAAAAAAAKAAAAAPVAAAA
jgi:hypothetical protein